MNKIFVLTTLLVLTASSAWAYRPFKSIGMPPVAADSPVEFTEVTSSLQDAFTTTGPDSIWDTTVTMRNISAKPIDRLDLELLMADYQGIIMTRLSCPLQTRLQPGGSLSHRLRELYFAYRGNVVAATVRSVTFADGSRWPAADVKVTDTNNLPTVVPARSSGCAP